ncbi:MAG: hypothetical protein HYR88_02825 [Verrucomicrobia bacterium]|nr:hypothetical protein [Verrucomicrobiota bacterium]MBI3869774.1 hypothetical protein [Verrucomicrobiota bacterium]
MPKKTSSGPAASARPRVDVLCAVLALICVIAWLFTRAPERRAEILPTEESASGAAVETARRGASNRLIIHGANAGPAPTAEQVVAAKLSQFARSRRGFAYALSQRHGVPVSGDVERFFAAVESGNWSDITNAFSKIDGGDSSAGHSAGRPPGIEHLWPAIIDAFGAAEQAHQWPAQQLLDYGNSVLDSLRPGMIYVGGTDSGRWIPELLNDTSEGERHIVITQNGLADGTYLDYLQLQYGDQVTTLSSEDSQNAFKSYVDDARKRLEHDTQFPDEPKQVRPGEEVRLKEDGRVEVGGQVAVMAINEALLKAFMDKNPDVPIALQESFPLRGTYSDALPIGPLMELHARDGQNAFTAERAGESLDYWRNTAQQVASNPETKGSTEAMKSYSHDAVAAANLLAAHNYGNEAEEGYRIASQLWPGNPESVGSLAGLLAQQGRSDEAEQMLRDFATKYPDQIKHVETIMAGQWRLTFRPP